MRVDEWMGEQLSVSVAVGGGGSKQISIFRV